MLDVFIAGNKQLVVPLLSDFSVADIVQVASVSWMMRRTWYDEGPDALWLIMYPILYTRIYKRPPLHMPDKGSLVRLVAQLNRECWRWRNKDFRHPGFGIFIVPLMHTDSVPPCMTGYLEIPLSEICCRRFDNNNKTIIVQEPFVDAASKKQETLAKLERKMQKKQMQMQRRTRK